MLRPYVDIHTTGGQHLARSSPVPSVPRILTILSAFHQLLHRRMRDSQELGRLVLTPGLLNGKLREELLHQIHDLAV